MEDQIVSVENLEIDLSKLGELQDAVQYGGTVTFITHKDDKIIYELLIPNHDRLFDKNIDCIEEQVSGIKSFKLDVKPNHTKECVRYYHVFKNGEYVNIPNNSPPKIVVTE